MCAALESAELAVVIEVVWVCASLFVWAVVACEDKHGVLGQSAFFKQFHYLSDLRVEACNHRSKLRMSFGCRVVARGVVAAIGALREQFAAKGLQQRVVRLA